MNAVYSERFCLAHRPTHPLSTYGVPYGRRAVLRSFSYAGYATTNAAIWLAIAGHYISVALPPGQNFGGALDLYQVVYAGETVAIDCTASSGDVWAAVSGYLLTDTSDRASQLPSEPMPDPAPPWRPEEPEPK